MMGIMFVTVEARQGHRLIADDAIRPIARCRVDPPQIGIRFGASDKECAGFVQPKEALEIQVGAVHYINRCGHRNHQVEHVDIVQFAVGNMYKTRDIPAQVQQRMHLDRCLGASKRRAWRQRQAQIDGGGIQRVNRVRQIQFLTFLGVDPPVSSLVGIGQSRALDRRANAHVVQLCLLCREAGLDIAQTFPVGQLCKR
jgi:hypothetical protein